MTSNQIAYFKVKVEQEHYKLSDAEAARHNKATEALTSQQLQEVARANRAEEAIKTAQLAETSRHAKVTESQTWASLNETIRHNSAVERETHRSNYQQELLKASSNAIQRELNQSVIRLNDQKNVGQALQNEFDYTTQNARIIQTVMNPALDLKLNNSIVSAIGAGLTVLTGALTTQTPTTSTTTISPRAQGIPTSVSQKLSTTKLLKPTINVVKNMISAKAVGLPSYVKR